MMHKMDLKTWTRAIALGLTATLFVGAQSAIAQTPLTREQAGAIFDSADTDTDGLLTKAEWLETLPVNLRQNGDPIWLRISPSGSAVDRTTFIDAYAPG